MSTFEPPDRKKVRRPSKYCTDEYEFVGGTRKKEDKPLKVEIDLKITVEISHN